MRIPLVPELEAEFVPIVRPDTPTHFLRPPRIVRVPAKGNRIVNAGWESDLGIRVHRDGGIGVAEPFDGVELVVEKVVVVEAMVVALLGVPVDAVAVAFRYVEHVAHIVGRTGWWWPG